MDQANANTGGPPRDPAYVNASRKEYLYAVYGTLWSVTTVVVLVRLYVRSWILKGWKLDDYLMIVALLCSVACFVGWAIMIQGGLGRHMSTITPDGWALYAKGSLAYSLSVTIGLGFVKSSVGAFLLQVGRRQKRWVRLTYFMIVFISLYTIAAILSLSLCSPKATTGNSSEQSYCSGANSFLAAAYFNSSMNIATDLIFATMPIPMLAHLQMNQRKKIAVIGNLCMGYVAGIAAIVKLIYQIQFSKTPDVTWDANYLIWAHVEFCVGVITASLPMFKPLLKSVLKSSLVSSGPYSNRNRKEYRQWVQTPSKSGADNAGSTDREADNIPVLPKLFSGGGADSTLELEERKQWRNKTPTPESEDDMTVISKPATSLVCGPELEAQDEQRAYRSAEDNPSPYSPNTKHSRRCVQSLQIGASIQR